MTSILVVGIILFAGFLAGEVAKLAKLPKVTGYILAGILLNPGVSQVIPQDFPQHTDLITNIALAFITFSVGGTLLYANIKTLGKTIFSLTIFEAEFAFVAVATVFILLGGFFADLPAGTWATLYIPLGLLTASLAAPTDPSATLAVIHEYQAEGEVSSTIMGVAAFDDILGILNYSLSLVVATVLMTHAPLTAQVLVVKPMGLVGGSILLGIGFGLAFNSITHFIERETEGMLIVLIFALICLCFGAARSLGVDELLPLVVMGVVVVNFNRMHEKIFAMLERYTEELIFVLFFTISGMHLEFSVLAKHWELIMLFVLFRGLGKFLGVAAGGYVSDAPAKIRKYVAGGLIPQGGIVIGLALLIQQNDTFAPFSAVLLNVIIGATVIHELLGPVLAKTAISRAGEIAPSVAGNTKCHSGQGPSE